MYIALKLRVKQITYKSTIQTDNTNRPKPEENQLRALKIYAFCWKIQQRASGPEESAAEVA